MSSKTRIAGLAIGLTGALLLAAPANATSFKSWGVWSDGSIAFSGTNAVDATYTLDSGVQSSEIITTDYDNEYFTADSPIGEIFGTNGPDSTNNYLKVSTQDDQTTDAVVEITFDSAVAAGDLALAVSDIDSDHVTITMNDDSSNSLTGVEINGSATTSAFNFCDYSASSCSDTSVPDIATNGNNVVATGQDSGTDGSTAWFRPSVAVKSITLTIRNDDSSNNSSTERIWLAQLSEGSSSSSNSPHLANTGANDGAQLPIAAALVAGGLALVARNRKAPKRH